MNLEKALDRLKEQGYKYTGKREMIVSLFAEEKRYLSAKDVLTHMQKEYPGVSFDTVYRNLSLFADLEILETTELEGEKKFRFSCSTPHHHHHLICMECGKTKHIHACPMEHLGTPFDEEFSVTGHKFEVYGYCADCKNNSKANV
ncbi:Fur family transcriptional regulator [Thalassobacillus sp. C254]|uniref:Fur family transcriptional regulator n=1 Tax=Thalassobacillus sp. C254 TaxID=1225341 RepID=UPI0006D21E6C|nr:Fur family transcriptional regulator [Thalassobacillus sp. C254]